MDHVARATERGGPFSVPVEIPRDRTTLHVAIRPDLRQLAATRAPLPFHLAIDASDDHGLTWYQIGGSAGPDFRDLLSCHGNRTVYMHALREQLVHASVIAAQGYRTRRMIASDTEERFYQLAVARLCRVTFSLPDDQSLRYAVDVGSGDYVAPPVRGRHSAALIGNFTAQSAAGPATECFTLTRTATAGSLIVVFGSSYATGSNQTHTFTDDPNGGGSNTYANQVDRRTTGSTQVLVSVASNNGGTRTASHRCKVVRTGSTDGCCISASEFSGVAASPTIVSNTATGNGTAASVAVTAGASSLFVGAVCYVTPGQTMTESTSGGWALLQEIDQGNAVQGHNAIYNTGVTGAQTAAWTISSTVDWGALIQAFTETAGPPTDLNVSLGEPVIGSSVF